MEKGSVELAGQQRVRHVPQKLLQQSSHIMDTVFQVQPDIHTQVKVLPQLRDVQKKSVSADDQDVGDLKNGK